jgi:3-hydroxybutyryl-CoA dehydrogenase
MKTPIKTIAVIGAGPKGREIALAALRAGYEAILEDISSARLEEAAAWIKNAQREVTGEAQAKPRSAASRSLHTASSVEEALRDADLIIEAVAEELEMKIELFTIFDKFAKPNAVFASSSSSFSIADMADFTVCQERCIGLRFSPSCEGKNILELVRTPDTSEETVAACQEVGRRMGKEVIVVSDADGNPCWPAPQRAAASQD